MGKVYNLSFMELLKKIDEYDLGTVVESEKGDFYKLTSIDCTKEERKFARMKNKGTSLRFMTYDNFRKKFRIVEEEKEKQIEEIEKLNFIERNIKYLDGFCFEEYRSASQLEMQDKINEIIRVVNRMQLDNKIKEK